MSNNNTINRKQLPPNEKMWSDDHRDTIHELLPGHMKLGETADIRVGQWFPIEVGGSIKIERISDEVSAIKDAFESVGVEVKVPLVGVSHEGHEYTPMQAYLVEIENWEPR